MNSLVVVLYLYILINCVHCAHETTCSEDQKHFAAVCFTPSPSKDVSANWFFSDQPKDGWYYTLGNHAARRHVFEILKGRRSTPQDNFENSCLVGRSTLSWTGYEVNITGYGNGRGSWDCTFSKDIEGLNICDGKTHGPSEYHEKFNTYPIYTDNKVFLIYAVCFPNGQAGWIILSKNPEMTANEKKVISEQVQKLGFSFEDHIVAYDKTCSK